MHCPSSTNNFNQSFPGLKILIELTRIMPCLLTTFGNTFVLVAISFEDMLANPIQFESDHPDMTIDGMVELYESFYLVETIEEKWGRCRSWKCMCESFMSAAICGHSLLFDMLYDKTLEFPLNILQRNWSFVAKPPDVLQLGLLNKKMRKKLRPSSNVALSLHAMTWTCFQQRKLR
jgi:hypothetical protein